MKVYVVVCTFYDCCGFRTVNVFKSEKEAQAYAVRAYLNVDEYGKGKDVDAFKEKIEKAGYVHNLTADYTIYEAELRGVRLDD